MERTILKAVPIIETIESAGYEAYFVGGAVRDSLLNRPITDLDITTSAQPETIQKLFPKTINVGIDHGTILIRYKKESYEITSFRTKEGEESSLENDLKYRDFTINAMAMNQTGQIIDPCNGQGDLKAKKITAVGSAEARFTEDPLRMLRAIRFSGQLNFSIDENTVKAITKLANLLENVAIERLTAEFEKLLLGNYLQEALETLVQTRLLNFLPNLRDQEDFIRNFSDYKLDNLRLEARWALLLQTIKISPEKSKEFLNKWTLSNQKKTEIQKLLEILQERNISEWTNELLYFAGQDNFVSIESLYALINNIDLKEEQLVDLKDQYDKLPIKERSDIVVNGRDIIKWLNRPGGPWLKRVITQLESEIVQGQLENSFENIRTWVLQWDNQKN